MLGLALQLDCSTVTRSACSQLVKQTNDGLEWSCTCTEICTKNRLHMYPTALMILLSDDVHLRYSKGRK